MALVLSMKLNGEKEARAFIAGVGRQMPFITKSAINQTADHIKVRERRAMARSFERPRPFTLNALKIFTASKKKLEARIFFKDVKRLKEHYVVPQVEGGARLPKGSAKKLRAKGLIAPGEFIVPARAAPLDKHGNVRTAFVNDMLKRINPKPVDLTKTRKRGGKSSDLGRVRKGQDTEYVVSAFKGTKGIFYVTPAKWTLVFYVVRRAPRYRKRLRFYEVANKAFDEEYENAFDEWFNEAIRTAR